MLGILSIAPGSPASTTGLRSIDKLISCNGNPLNDWIDFLYSARGLFLDLVYRRGPVVRKLTIRRNPSIEWGFTFHGQEPAVCRKKCIFCFVDQLPPGVRSSLLVKDDDVRYSFVQGTYVTLDNDDTEYAIRKHLTPLHISVHSTDPAVRGRILGTRREEPVLQMLENLSRAGIEMETQIVVVPGFNDGEELAETLEDLSAILGVVSAGVVPVGLTRHRNGLPRLRRPSKTEAIHIIDQCSVCSRKTMQTRGSRWVYPSDEFFIIAGLDIPPLSFYENCTLRENGIGLLAELFSISGKKFTGNGTVCTGTLAAPYIRHVLEDSTYNVIAVENTLLGSEIGAAGLLSGADIVRSVKMHADSYNSVILPGVMFNHDMLTLDDLSPDEISKLTGREILVIRNLEELA
ncbi:hypothetical protein DRQ25_17035 [Candidatus Fermentibacteria bacterium]|nr:MAG: hypothetical protein DRQ25_17035 [Candidatus Fermentibacteria bacterium]